MGFDVSEVEVGYADSVVRVDNWDTTGRHWIYYFRKSEEDDHYELASSASIPYEGDRIGAERGIAQAEEKMEQSGFEVTPHSK